MIAVCDLSGGASGDSSAVWLGCWDGGRNADGNAIRATIAITPKYANGAYFSAGDSRRRRLRRRVLFRGAATAMRVLPSSS